MKKLKATKAGRSNVITGSVSNRYTDYFRSNKKLMIPLTSLVIVALATVVPIAIYRSLAATSTASVEAENIAGSITSPAQSVSDGNASGGKYVRFGSGTGGTTVLFDDFLGTSIDTTKWDIYDRISDQDNRELNCVVPANVSVSNGILRGVAKHEDRTCGDSIQAPELMHYTSWQIAQKAAPYKYGTLEVRAKEPGGTGIWPTIFLLGYLWQPSQADTADFPGHNWPHGGWGEIDVAEFLFNNRSQVNNVVHFETPGGSVQNPLPFDATSRFMVYRLQWSANALVWSVDAEDGVGFRTLRTITDVNNIPNVPMYLTINEAVGGIGGGTPDPNTFPQTFQIDWVRITQ